MSYKSPIEIYVQQLRIERERTFESEILKALQGYEITVNKDELIKALKYDRDQYQRGYDEGYDEGFDKGYDADKWISVKDGLPQSDGRYLAYGSAFGRCMMGILYYDTRLKHFSDGEVTHWQPLPAPPTEKPYD